MNKNDIKLIIIITTISIIILSIFLLLEDKNAKIANIYYENNLILSIDLTIKEQKEYQVDGYNGTVKLIANDGKIKVNTENSPLHLCSKQGYISKSYETIVCLPNKITIKIENNDDIDTIVK